MLYRAQSPGRDPFALMRTMMRDFDRTSSRSGIRSEFPAVNIWQSDEGVAITAELPGVEPSDIEITVKDDFLTLSGERKVPDVPEGARWHLNERRFGKFSRAVRLPYEARDDHVEARFENGVLRIVVGRPEEQKPRRVEIKTA